MNNEQVKEANILRNKLRKIYNYFHKGEGLFKFSIEGDNYYIAKYINQYVGNKKHPYVNDPLHIEGCEIITTELVSFSFLRYEILLEDFSGYEESYEHSYYDDKQVHFHADKLLAYIEKEKLSAELPTKQPSSKKPKI